VSEVEKGRYQPISTNIDEYLGSASARALIGHNGGPPLEDESKIPGWITEAQFARQLGLSIATVRRWRRRRYGPPWVKIGRKDYTQANAAADFAAELLARRTAAAEVPGRGRPRRGGR
jgi:hypothetical protein